MKLLWLKNNLLHPLDSGGKIRTYNTLKRLSQMHDLHYVCFADNNDEVSRASEYCNEVFTVPSPSLPGKGSFPYRARVFACLFSRYPFTILSYRSSAMKALVVRLMEKFEYDVIILDFLTMGLNLPAHIGVPRVHFSHNVEATIWARHVKNQTNPLKRLVFAREGRRTERFEREVIESFEHTICVSKGDRDHFLSRYDSGKVSHVPPGVDVEYYKPNGREGDPCRVVFLGSMDWMPNIDAVHWFVQEVCPMIRKRVAEFRLDIVGRDPVGSVKDLALEHTWIRVTGSVDDTRPYITSASCTVVPIRIGGGTRLKVYELMAMARPVVSTTIGAEGLEYIDGENILIKDGPVDMADAIVGVLEDAEFCSSIGKKARSFVVDNCSWDVVADKFNEALLRVVKG